MLLSSRQKLEQHRVPSYQFIDSNVRNRTTYYYKLQDIGLNGTTTDHGPKSATPTADIRVLGLGAMIADFGMQNGERILLEREKREEYIS